MPIPCSNLIGAAMVIQSGSITKKTATPAPVLQEQGHWLTGDPPSLPWAKLPTQLPRHHHRA